METAGNGKMKTRIVLADDHPLLAEGLKNVLEELDEVEVGKPCLNGRQLLDTLHSEKTDMVLLDLNMPGPDGIEILKIIRRDFPALKVIVFTTYTQPKISREVREIGADGFLSKTSTTQTIKEAVSTVRNGGTWFGNSEMNHTSPITKDDFQKKFQLTNREIEIIRMIAGGLTTRQISEQLFLSEFTVNTHRRNISRKLDIDTPVALMNFAREQGLL